MANSFDSFPCQQGDQQEDQPAGMPQIADRAQQQVDDGDHHRIAQQTNGRAMAVRQVEQGDGQEDDPPRMPQPKYEAQDQIRCRHPYRVGARIPIYEPGLEELVKSNILEK